MYANVVECFKYLLNSRAMFLFAPRRKILLFLSGLTITIILFTTTHFLYDDSGNTNVGNGNGNLKMVSDEDIQREMQLEYNRKETKFKRMKPLSSADTKNKVSVMEVEPLEVAQGHRVEFLPKKKLPGGAVKKNPVDDSDKPDLSADGLKFIPRRRVVHFDLKGAPPKISYLKTLFPLLRSAGATTLLMEYEDMFPFWGHIKNISALNAFTKEDVAEILDAARENQLEVIPLVQTFGHLEMALKLEEFRDLREVPYHPQAVCPSQNGTWTLVTAIIDQVLELHPDANWLHIGCDEVYHLGQCPLCVERLAAANNDPESKIYHDGKTLFLEHVHRLAKYVKESKGIIPIIWDDMLRNIPSQTIRDSGLGPLVEPMIWVYIEDIDRFIDPVTWANFGEIFPHGLDRRSFQGGLRGETLPGQHPEARGEQHGLAGGHAQGDGGQQRAQLPGPRAHRLVQVRSLCGALRAPAPGHPELSP